MEPDADHTTTDQRSTAWFVPCVPLGEADEQVRFILKPMRDGRRAFLVYPTLDRLVESCGEQQAWVALDEKRLEEAYQTTGAEVVAVDVPLTEEQQLPSDPDALREIIELAKEHHG